MSGAGPAGRAARRLIARAPSWYRLALGWRKDFAVASMASLGSLERMLGEGRAEALWADPNLPSVVKSALFRAALALRASGSEEEALAFGERVWPQLAAQATLAARAAWAGVLAKHGELRRPLALLEAANAQSGAGTPTGLQAKLRKQAALLDHGVAMSQAHKVSSPAYRANSNRILYYVASSTPHHGTGYAVRTNALVAALQAQGWEVPVVARVGYPNDRWDYPGLRLAAPTANLSGITYHFAPDHTKMQYARDIQAYHERSVEALVSRCHALRPALIHAASNYNCGLAAVEAGRRLGIPVIYEMRGLWHVTKTADQPGYESSDHFAMIAGLEAQAAAGADHVFCITSGVRDVLIGQGVAAENLSILPNAVDPSQFEPMADTGLAARYGLQGSLVIGYLGSLNAYEGVDDLIACMPEVARRHAGPVKLLVVGDGSRLPELRALAISSGVADMVVLTGRVPFSEARAHYAAMDIVAVPRKGTLVCELISPLKPFEPMAMGKPLVVSDVAALADIVAHEKTGLCFAKNSRASLTEALLRLAGNEGLRLALGQNAATWVRAERTWPTLAREVALHYRRLLGAS